MSTSELAKEPQPFLIPSASSAEVARGITVQPPLTRCGTGPPLLLVVDEDLDLRVHDKTLDPPPLLKWAEEGFTVAQVAVSTENDVFAARFRLAVEEVTKQVHCEPKDKIGIVVHCKDIGGVIRYAQSGGTVPQLAIIVSYGSAISSASFSVAASVPILAHLSSGPEDARISPHQSTRSSDTVSTPTTYHYPHTAFGFTIPSEPSYNHRASALAHSRSLLHIKRALGGPFFDLEAIWDEHTRLEFADRNVAQTMATMVAEPYVNHVPTLTGGVGRDALTSFYRDHFVFGNPDDTQLELVSRTVGHDRVVDEFLFQCTHDRVIDWLAPGIPPTGRKINVPFTSVVNIRGDRLFHEHIGWDQGTLLKQLGLLPDWLPFPYPLSSGRTAGPGKRLEYRVPVAGVECAHKLVDESAVPSNGMLSFAVREVDMDVSSSL